MLQDTESLSSSAYKIGNMTDEKVFLTEQRRAVLRNQYDGSDSNARTHKSRIRKKSKLALDELIEVASSPKIDNSDVFDPETVYTLISILLRGTGGLMYETEEAQQKALENAEDNAIIAWDPDPDYANELYVRLDGGLRGFHEQNDDRPQGDR